MSGVYSPITFPGLGIEVNPDPVLIHFGGGYGVRWYGLVIALGLILAVCYAIRRAPQFGLTEDNILNLVLCALPAAIVGARLYYCVFNWRLYAGNPVSVLFIWEGGLAIYGGVIGAILGAAVYARCSKTPFGPLLDIGALGLLIGQATGRWGNFFNREAHGGPTDSFLRMGLAGADGTVAYYHPTFLYESLWNLLGLALLHVLSRKYRRYDGQIFTMYVAWYGLGRAWIEGLRTDSLYLFSTGIRVSQLLAALSCLAAVGLLIWNLYVRPRDPEGLYVNRKRADAVKEPEI